MVKLYEIRGPIKIQFLSRKIETLGTKWGIERDLGDENDVGGGFADAAAAIVADEAEAGDAGGADVLVAASAVGNPFEGVGAHGTAVVHRRSV